MSVIKSAAGNRACWEVNGCGYSAGATVDLAFGCKPLPPRGLVDPCCSNMAFSFNSRSLRVFAAVIMLRSRWVRLNRAAHVHTLKVARGRSNANTSRGVQLPYDLV